MDFAVYFFAHGHVSSAILDKKAFRRTNKRRALSPHKRRTIMIRQNVTVLSAIRNCVINYVEIGKVQRTVHVIKLRRLNITLLYLE